MKSNEDLHKLWFVLIKEKNSILSDENFLERNTGEEVPKERLISIKKSMVNLKRIVESRAKIRKNYWNHLEE